MTDIMTPTQRSARMALIRGSNTKPELRVRCLLHGLGYRFRLHRRDLPGRPDIVFPARRKLVFIHGCFWHHHEGCKVGHLPRSRQEYWAQKFTTNKERDARNLAEVASMGWDTQVIWECEVGDLAALSDRLRVFLGPPGRSQKINLVLPRSAIHNPVMVGAPNAARFNQRKRWTGHCRWRFVAHLY